MALLHARMNITYKTASLVYHFTEPTHTMAENEEIQRQFENQAHGVYEMGAGFTNTMYSIIDHFICHPSPPWSIDLVESTLPGDCFRLLRNRHRHWIISNPNCPNWTMSEMREMNVCK